MAALQLTQDASAPAADIASLLGDAWRDSGRPGAPAPSWRPFDTTPPAEGISLREGGRLLGYAVVRPMEGMDAIDFLYVRRAGRRPSLVGSLVERARDRLLEVGSTGIVYAGFGWWRSGFADPIARAFRARGFSRFDGVFLARPLERQGPPPSPLAPGDEVRPFQDEDLDAICQVMLEAREPEAIYWDMGLCRRSIQNAGNPIPPRFPDGLGQVAWRDGRPVGFALSTRLGYVNHVYVRPGHEGRGLGAALTTRLLAAIAAKGLLRATILTHDTNPRAIGLYRRLGFTIDFTYPQFFWKAPPRG